MNYKEFDFWCKEKLWELRKEIILGSMYYSDYDNSFNIPRRTCFSFFDGFVEYCFIIENENENGLTEYDDIYNKYDNADELWNYFYGLEFPFGK